MLLAAGCAPEPEGQAVAERAAAEGAAPQVPQPVVGAAQGDGSVDLDDVFELYRTQPGDKALAIARDEAGRWAYGTSRDADDADSARLLALEQCRRYARQFGVTAECEIFADGDVIVWNWRQPFARYGALLADKAFALAEDAEGNWVYGVGYEREDSADAIEAAMAECRARREEFTVDAECRVVAIGDILISDGGEPSAESDSEDEEEGADDAEPASEPAIPTAP